VSKLIARSFGLPVVVAVLLAGCGSSGTKTVTVISSSSTSTHSGPVISTIGSTSATTTTSSSASATTSSPAPVQVVHLATFQSPSGNIGCVIIAGTARCDLKQRSWSPPPRPKSCPDIVDFGQGLIVLASGPGRLVCAGDTALDPSAQTLAYNTDTVVGGFRCESRTTGMLCTNTGDGHGFFIARETYRTF